MKRTATDIPLSERLSALADPMRLRIARVLAGHELSVGEVARVVQVPQSTMSRHLKSLSDAGWLSRRAEGTATLYALRPEELADDMRTMWSALRDRVTAESPSTEDDARVEAVLQERRTDSISFFGRVAGQWDSVRSDLFGEQFTRLGLLALLPDDWVVADIGCGTGNGAELLAPCVKQVIAVDQSGPMLDAARARLAGVSNVRFVQGPMEAIPLEDQSVDAATAILVMHHVRDITGAMREALRVLKPGGVLLIVDMLAHDRTEYRRTMGHEHLGFAPEPLRAALLDAGFASARVRPLPADAHAKGPGLFVARAQKFTTETPRH